MDNLRVSSVGPFKLQYENKKYGVIKNNDMTFTFGIDDNSVTLLADEVRAYYDKTVEVYKDGRKIFESHYDQLVIKNEGKEVVMIND